MQNVPFNLSPWQKAQVTLLYHFASLDYLNGLRQRLHALMAWTDPTLDLDKFQRRDCADFGKKLTPTERPFPKGAP